MRGSRISTPGCHYAALLARFCQRLTIPSGVHTALTLPSEGGQILLSDDIDYNDDQGFH